MLLITRLLLNSVFLYRNDSQRYDSNVSLLLITKLCVLVCSPAQDTPDTPCTVVDFNSMSCLTPPLTTGRNRRQVATAENISYTVVVDNAAGPDFSNPLLQLNVLPDPVIGDLSDALVASIISINVSQYLAVC